MWAGAVAFTGGINTRVLGVPLRSRDPVRPVVVSLVIVLIQAAVYRRDAARDAARLESVVRRGAPLAAAVIAASLAAHAVRLGSFGVGGADAYGYVNQAYDWAAGTLPRPIPLHAKLPFAESDQLQIPLGYRIGPEPHTMVPTYAPGLPLMMAVALAFGRCGPFFVVPCFAALFVWWTFRLGESVAGPVTGLLAAILAAASPVVLYQALWPMSDIPAGALWMGAAVFSLRGRTRDAAVAGTLTAVGLLVRPNLLPLAVLPAACLALTSQGRERWQRIAHFLLPLAPVVIAVAALNMVWFGSPLNSGYGAAREIYLRENIVPNLKLYGAWLWQSQSPWVLLALLPALPLFRRDADRTALMACAVLCVATLACYVSYSQFEVWWYLRFLMPAFGALAVLMAAGLRGLANSLPRPFGEITASVGLGLTLAATLSFAGAAGVFDRMTMGERRYIDLGEYVASHLPANAALLSMQHSGSLRFYSGRLTLRYDRVRKPWAADVAPGLESAGYHPYMVIDDWEAPYVREQFGLEEGPLPWAIAARMRELGGMTVYDMSPSANGSPVALEPTVRGLCEMPGRAQAPR